MATPLFELRVHGVSGTSPESLLDRPLVSQLAGDRIAGFYRPRLPAERTNNQPNPFAPARPAAAELEGFNWGGLTSGSPGRAFWLLLLPFTLVNIAPRARPAGRSDDPHSGALVWLIWYTSRLLALAMTALFVQTAVGVGEDLIGWQCAGGAGRCTNASPGWIFTKLLGTWSNGVRVGGLPTGRLLLLGAAVPTALLLLLWISSQRTIDRYEHTVPTGPSFVDNDADAEALEVGLASARMWRNSNQVRRLRTLHLQFGTSVIIWSLLLASLRLPAGPLSVTDVLGLPFRDGHNLALLVPIAVTVYSLVVLSRPSFVGRATSRGWWISAGVVWAFLLAALVVEAIGLLGDHNWVPGRYRASYQRLPADGLPGFASTFIWLFIVIVVLLAKLATVVAIASVRRSRSAPPEPHQPLRPGARGNITTILATLGVFAGAVFTAGGYTFSAAWLHTGSLKPGFGEVSKIYEIFAIPEIARIATLTYSYSVGFFLVFLIVLLVRFIHGLLRPSALADAVERDYPDYGTDPARARSIRRDIYLGQIVDRTPSVVVPLVVVGALLSSAFGVLVLLEHAASIGWVDSLMAHVRPAESVSRPSGFFSPVSLEGTGAYLAVITMVGLVAVALAAFRVPATRRSVGILWDVASFWPRSTHPLAAPCYAERAVPDLVTRVTWLRGQPEPPRVVLSAHSQGTVISAAVVFQLQHLRPRCDRTGVARSRAADIRLCVAPVVRAILPGLLRTGRAGVVAGDPHLPRRQTRHGGATSGATPITSAGR